MKGIDRNGRLFGVVNVIDMIAVVLVVALVVSAGAVFLATSTSGGNEAPSNNGTGDSGSQNATKAAGRKNTAMVVHFQLLNDAPYVVRGINNASASGNENIVAVLGTARTTPVETGPNTTSNASLRLRLNVIKQQTQVRFKGERLYVGKTVQLDLGTVVVRAVVTGFEMNRTTTTREARRG